MIDSAAVAAATSEVPETGGESCVNCLRTGAVMALAGVAPWVADVLAGQDAVKVALPKGDVAVAVAAAGGVVRMVAAQTDDARMRAVRALCEAVVDGVARGEGDDALTAARALEVLVGPQHV